MRPLPLQVILHFRQQIAHSTGAEIYQVEVAQAPGRGWGGPLVAFGLDDDQAQAIRTLYRSYLKRHHSSAAQALTEREIEPLRAAGSQIFKALPTSVQARLRQAQSIVQRKSQSLELVLTFDSSAQPLVNLPWELLHDPDSRYFFALRGGGIVRRLLLPTASKVAPSFRPRTILGLWAEPDDVAGLTARRKYVPAPGQGDYGLTWLEGPDSLGQLEQALAAGTFDGLHVVAHGRAGEAWSDLSLALAGGDGHARWLSPDQWVTILAGYPQIRFVYLDICSSSESSGHEYTPGGLATALLGIGQAAVIAMQDEMSQEAAGLMAQVFYQELARGATLSQAVANGRRAIRVKQDDPVHWSIPALYVQQKPTVEDNSPLADWLLDRISGQSIQIMFVLLGLMLLMGYLSRALALISIAAVPTGAIIGNTSSWSALAPYIAGGILVSTLTATLMRHGQQQVGEKFSLKGRGWLEVLLHKYTAAFVWAMLAWMLIWLIWLGLQWSGIAVNVEERQVVWAIGLLSIAGSSYVGARQAIRQKLLFLPIGYSRPKTSDWFLLLAMAFMPLGLAWLFSWAWPWLSTVPGFLVVLMMLIILVVAVGRNQHDPG